MEDYIKREDALAFQENVESYIGFNRKNQPISMTKHRDLIAYLVKIPAADVVPVKHGRWIKDCDRVMGDGWTYTQRHCSECGGQSVECVNYCQFCGARMDKDGDA